MSVELPKDAGTRLGATGVLGALEEELGPLRDWERAAPYRERIQSLGLEVARFDIPLAGRVGGPAAPLLVACSGVGKVAAAHAAAALGALGAKRLLVVGTCGGLHPRTPVGALVHADLAVQWDLAVRAGREHRADPALLAAWRAAVGGELAHILTADRPAVRLVERWRRHRALARAARARGAPAPLAVADMETAAAAAVAVRLGLPWAALRAVSDSARPLAAGAFAKHLPTQGGRAATTIPTLLARLAGGASGGGS